MTLESKNYVVAANASSPERKVNVGGAFAYFGGVALLGFLNAVSDANLVSALPDTLETFVVPVIPAVIGYVAAYFAKHTKRPDLGA
jgi:membrane protein DedA with SNARE-associated domain